MPSLRRSFSSPSVRSSPYPSSSSPSSTRTRTAPHPHPRRSSGAATGERRVLADIEWWRVHDGQCDLDIQDRVHDDVQALDSDIPLGGTVTLSVGGGSMEPQTSFLHSFSLDSMQSVHPDVFDALSVAPYSPNRRGWDSGESTPEISTTPLETDRPGVENQMSYPFGLYPPSLMRAGGRLVNPSFGLRSVSAPSLSRQGTSEPFDFGDMGGGSFSLDQNLFQ